MLTYDTLTEALNDLRQRGYGLDYNLTGAQAYCAEVKEYLGPDELTIKEVYRFEGDSNPDDNMVLYALESRKTPANKGVLVAAYGPDVEAEAATFIQRLDTKLASG
ncbi:phosphoribosylpyrophosphate synthetase [Hymenobacter terricola]|uniref:phosphoribosylpyrophosphate synthetase n=1 Tax=Hymenobacter terricola TaxID=2819236 RepID=UPI001B305300|nr:phosphoribosylpyrophosphate synthetase [Hymenobacter terricola]